MCEGARVHCASKMAPEHYASVLWKKFFFANYSIVKMEIDEKI